MAARALEIKQRDANAAPAPIKKQVSPKYKLADLERFEKTLNTGKKKTMENYLDEEGTVTYKVGSTRSRKSQTTKEDILFVVRQKCRY